MDERGRKRTSKWDLVDGKRNIEDNRPANVRDGDYRASPNENKSYSGRYSSAHSADDNTKYPTDTKDGRSKYEPDVSVRDHASGNRGTCRNNSFDRDTRSFSEAGTNWDEDGSRRDYARSPKSSWQRPARSWGKSTSRSRSPVSVDKHESGMNDRHRSRPEVPAQTCRDFTSGRCRRGTHCPFLHPSTQNFEDRRYDYEHREESYQGGKYSHYNASDRHYNDYTRDTSGSKREYDGNSRRISSNHGADHEPRRSADIPCTFFAAGNCRNGKFCRFSHQIQTPRSPGERAHDVRWIKPHSPERVGQIDSGTKFSDTVDPRDEGWRKNHSPEKIGQLDQGTEFSNTVDPRNVRLRKNHSPEKIGQVDRRAKSSITEYGKEGRWRTNRGPDRVGQINKGMPFSEIADPHVVGQGNESQSKVVSSSMSCRSDNNMQADYAGHEPPTTMDNLVKVEVNQSSIWKSDSHNDNHRTFELKGVGDWIGDKMSPEWNPKVALAGTVAQEELAYAIHTSDSVSHNLPSHEELQYMNNVLSEMPNKVEKVNSQQSSNPINGTTGAFSYGENVHVATNFNSGFLSGNYVQPSTQDVLVATLGNLNAAGQGQYSSTPNFPGNNDASVIRTSTANYDMSSVTTNCEDPKTSEALFGATPASTIVRQAHLTDLSASLAHLLGKGQQLPQLYTAINPLNAVSSVEASNRIASQFPVESIQPYPPVGYQPVCDNAGEIEHAQHNPKPGILSMSEDVKQETPSAEQNAGEAYKNGCAERKLDRKPDTDSMPATNPQTIHEESTKGKSKQAKLQEGSPLGEGKVDGGKKVKDAKALRDFKHALVNFVKELLKPAWKDDQIDKAGYKTIVKKVVDKVSSTIQESNVPQTPEKVDHYLSASKPKLTKLVQAYVDRNRKKQA